MNFHHWCYSFLDLHHWNMHHCAPKNDLCIYDFWARYLVGRGHVICARFSSCRHSSDFLLTCCISEINLRRRSEIKDGLGHWKLRGLPSSTYQEVFLPRAHVPFFCTVHLRQTFSESLIWGKYAGCGKRKAGSRIFITKTSYFHFSIFSFLPSSFHIVYLCGKFPDRWSSGSRKA